MAEPILATTNGTHAEPVLTVSDALRISTSFFAPCDLYVIGITFRGCRCDERTDVIADTGEKITMDITDHLALIPSLSAAERQILQRDIEAEAASLRPLVMIPLAWGICPQCYHYGAHMHATRTPHREPSHV